MAPEQLLGKLLKMPCDIYAFGMTLYEIFMNEIPLGHINYVDFIDLVVQRDVRPERPDDEDAPQLSDAVWELAERCWVKDPKLRPIASAVCDTLLHLLETAAISQPQLSNLPQNLTLRGHTNWVVCATFSPDGKYIVSGSDGCTIIVWDAQTGNIALGPLKMHTKGVGCVAFSPNGRQIASGSVDKTILVWDAVTGKVVAGPFKGHTNCILSVCFSPNGKQIASGSHDNSIRVWDAQTGYLLVGPLTGHTEGVTSVVFSGDGKKLASGSKDKTIRVWDVKSGRLIWGPLRGHNHNVRFVGFSSDGKRIVSVSYGGDVCVWNTDTGALVSGPSKQHEEGALAVVFTPRSTFDCAVSPNGKWIAENATNNYKTVQVWDAKTGQVVATFSEHTEEVWSVTFSPDSKQILTTSMDKTIQVHTLDL
jgi:WD40 repeat protein